MPNVRKPHRSHMWHLLSRFSLVLFHYQRKKNQTLDGIFVRVNQRTEFYPGLKSCPVGGSPYWLVTNYEFEHQVSSQDIQRLFRGAWRVKISGDLSRIGSYGDRGRYWREIRVSHILDVQELVPCDGLQ
jgi:hypothetical protein